MLCCHLHAFLCDSLQAPLRACLGGSLQSLLRQIDFCSDTVQALPPPAPPDELDAAGQPALQRVGGPGASASADSTQELHGAFFEVRRPPICSTPSVHVSMWCCVSVLEPQ